jgi:hypothetical protein
MPDDVHGVVLDWLLRELHFAIKAFAISAARIMSALVSGHRDSGIIPKTFK